MLMDGTLFKILPVKYFQPCINFLSHKIQSKDVVRKCSKCINPFVMHSIFIKYKTSDSVKAKP